MVLVAHDLVVDSSFVRRDEGAARTVKTLLTTPTKVNDVGVTNWRHAHAVYPMPTPMMLEMNSHSRAYGRVSPSN